MENDIDIFLKEVRSWLFSTQNPEKSCAWFQVEFELHFDDFNRYRLKQKLKSCKIYRFPKS